MRTPCCLLSVGTLLVGALVVGNPFLPPRAPAHGSSPTLPAIGSSSDRAGAGPSSRRDPRPIAPFAARALWQPRSASSRASPVWAYPPLRVLVRPAGSPAVRPLPAASHGGAASGAAVPASVEPTSMRLGDSLDPR